MHVHMINLSLIMGCDYSDKDEENVPSFYLSVFTPLPFTCSIPLWNANFLCTLLCGEIDFGPLFALSFVPHL